MQRLRKGEYAMRKLARSIARANMRKAGIQKPNKWHMGVNPIAKLPVRQPSYFASYWREYITA